MNLGSNGMSGKVLQYFTRAIRSDRLSPGAAAGWRAGLRSAPLCGGGLIVGGISPNYHN